LWLAATMHAPSSAGTSAHAAGSCRQRGEGAGNLWLLSVVFDSVTVRPSPPRRCPNHFNIFPGNETTSRQSTTDA
jgi:hypothetical protein